MRLSQQQHDENEGKGIAAWNSGNNGVINDRNPKGKGDEKQVQPGPGNTTLGVEIHPGFTK